MPHAVFSVALHSTMRVEGGEGRICHMSENVAGCAQVLLCLRGKSSRASNRGGRAVITIKTKQKLSVRVVR